MIGVAFISYARRRSGGGGAGAWSYGGGAWSVPKLSGVRRPFEPREHALDRATGKLVRRAAITKRASAASSARASMAVGTLVLKKRLVLNAPCRCLLGTLLGEKSWDINKPLETF
jgi:hypothetical protein